MVCWEPPWPCDLWLAMRSDKWYSSRHCVLKGRLLSLKQDSSNLHYKVAWASSSPAFQVPAKATCRDNDTASLLHSYFALSHSLSGMYKQWAVSDANFAKRAPAFAGVRILNQDAWETLVSFICSSNNNISRISRMSSRSSILLERSRDNPGVVQTPLRSRRDG